MRTPSLAVASVLAVSLALPAAVHAASSQTPSFTVRENLTTFKELRGTVSFARPSGWQQTAGGKRHSYVAFRVTGGECKLDLTVSLRGKATRQSVRAQIADAVGDAPLGSGKRPGGAWGTDGPTLSGGEGGGDPIAGLYGIAPVRVAANRYGQIRITSRLGGCDADSADAKALLAPKSTTVGQVNRVLKTAKTSLRVAWID